MYQLFDFPLKWDFLVKEHSGIRKPRKRTLSAMEQERKNSPAYWSCPQNEWWSCRRMFTVIQSIRNHGDELGSRVYGCTYLYVVVMPIIITVVMLNMSLKLLSINFCMNSLRLMMKKSKDNNQ